MFIHNIQMEYSQIQHRHNNFENTKITMDKYRHINFEKHKNSYGCGQVIVLTYCDSAISTRG